jgi:hypothetical protein
VSNSPLIRIAVNLCLTAAMVSQPMAIVAAQGTCAQGSSSGSCCETKTVCTACKCCEVQSDGKLCGCCGVDEEEVGGCRTKKVTKPLDDELVSFSSCRCGINSEPFAPTPHRVPVTQNHDLVVVAYLDHVGSDAGLPVQPDRAVSRLAIVKLSPHFSQRFLCIWRI